MNLQSYIADLIYILNNIVIPFILGIAFLVFVINVFRFFVLGGTNPDSQEKAKRLAVYGVGAFVFIIIFWGIVNLLTSSFGLQLLGERESRCSDYECPDGSNPAANTQTSFSGSGFGSGTGDPRGAEIGGPAMPSSPSLNTPEMESPFISPSGSGGLDAQTPPDTSPNIPNSGLADYSDVTREAINSVEAVFPILQTTMLSDQFAAIGNEQLPDSVRVNTARAFLNAGFITNDDFDSVLNGINAVRAQGNFPPISSSFAVADPAYTADLVTYSTSVQSASDQITQWYGNGITAENEIDSLFNTEYSLEARYAAVDDVIERIGSRDQEFNETLEETIMSALETERDYTQRPN